MLSPTTPNNLTANQTSDAQSVIAQLATWLQAGETCWLITILATWGSSPRPAGTLMVWSQRGKRGSLSGGCIEDELLSKLANGGWRGEHPEKLSYGVSAEQAYRMRLPCGGQMSLLLECLQPGNATLRQIETLHQAMLQRLSIVREIDLQTGQWQWFTTQSKPKQNVTETTQNTIQHYLGPAYRLLIIGANEIAEHLCQLGAVLNMEVEVCDPREDAFTHWPYPWIPQSQALPDDWLRDKACDAHTAVVTLAHDPRVDDMALMEALTAPAYYIGALGSQRNAATRRDRLHQLGLNAAQIDRLNAPIGLAIGSRTPAEIAIAISADLIAHQRSAVATPRTANLATEPSTRAK